MKTVALGEVAEIVMGQAPPGKACNKDGEGIPFVKAGEFEQHRPVIREWTTKPLRLARDSDVLVCVVGATAGKVNKGIDCAIGRSVAALRPRDDLVDSNFLYRFMQGEVQRLRSVSQGLAQGVITRDMLGSTEIPFPPLGEQRRIAAILDQADELRHKRLETLAQLASLEESIFLDLFDDQAIENVSFSAMTLGMRNGLSPAKAGQVMADVLTLSAVTQGRFDPTAAKSSTFVASPPPEMRVSADDFLICRGNGNLNLCGVGVHPKHDYPDLTFPDTVIAATLDGSKVDPVFLETAWKRPAVRRQIEAVARTTNGTFKINQQSLGAVQAPLPPLAEQQDFARRLRAIPNPGLGELNDLFASLQSRAFSGKL